MVSLSMIRVDYVRLLLALPLVFALGFASVVQADPNDTEGCLCISPVGNADCDYQDIVDIGDLTLIIDYLFISNRPLINREEANADGDPAGLIDIGDVTILIDYLFISGSPLPDCPQPFNTPPKTKLERVNGVFINSISSASPFPGISMKWEGFDLVDHPYSSPPFKYEWRLYGPYYTQNIDGNVLPDTTWEFLLNQFTKTVFRRSNGEVYIQGEGRSFESCDTIPVPYTVDPTGFLITCDTVLVDTVAWTNIHGILDTILDVNDAAFANDPLFNRVALSSANGIPLTNLTINDSTELFDLFWNEPSDSTIEQKFIFWIRSVDPLDSTLFDPTPAFQTITVIDPHQERDIGLFDTDISFRVNGSNQDSAKAYWTRSIASWASTSGLTINYDPAVDYKVISTSGGFKLPLRKLLSYKTLVLFSELPYPGALSNPAMRNDIFRAVENGVNIWLAGRAPVFGGEATGPEFDVYSRISASLSSGMRDLFGVDNTVYSGWELDVLLNNWRIEDFVGAHSMDTTRWPDITIDSSILHRRYDWKDHYPWIDTIASLPEVNWFTPTAGAEVMYSYKSLYGSDHWLPNTAYNFDGKPVMQRFQGSNFRTIFSLFTPLPFEDTAIQPLVNNVLDWLFGLSTASSVNSEVDVIPKSRLRLKPSSDGGGTLK